MKNIISFEWDIEAMDGEDIVDHDHRDTLKEFNSECLRDAIQTGTLVLVRDVGNEDDGLIDRTWGYVKDGHLPERFATHDKPETKIPAKFHNELKRAIAYIERQRLIGLARQKVGAE